MAEGSVPVYTDRTSSEQEGRTSLADLATVRGLARPGSPPRSPVTLTWLAASIGAVVTALVVFDVVAWEYRNTAAHLVLETVDACIALLISYLVYGRFLRSRRLQDFLLLQGLLLLAVAGFGTTVALLALGEDRGGRLDVWLPMAVRVAGALFVTAAAVLGTHRLLRPVWVRWSWAPAGGVLAASIIVLGAFAAHLPVALNPSTSPDTSRHFALGHPFLVGAQALTVLCFAASAYSACDGANRSTSCTPFALANSAIAAA